MTIYGLLLGQFFISRCYTDFLLNIFQILLFHAVKMSESGEKRKFETESNETKEAEPGKKWKKLIMFVEKSAQSNLVEKRLVAVFTRTIRITEIPLSSKKKAAVPKAAQTNPTHYRQL